MSAHAAPRHRVKLKPLPRREPPKGRTGTRDVLFGAGATLYLVWAGSMGALAGRGAMDAQALQHSRMAVLAVVSSTSGLVFGFLAKPAVDMYLRSDATEQ